MRGTVAGLPTPHPLGASLPGLYLDDSFVQRMCSGLDEVLAPVISTLDCLPAYLDPGTAPEDVLGWLAGWVGLALDGGQEPTRQRELILSAYELHRRRGTAAGLKAALEAELPVSAEVADSGGTEWSSDAEHALPGATPATVVVRLRAEAGVELDARRIDALVAGLKPAHVIHRVELLDQETHQVALPD